MRPPGVRDFSGVFRAFLRPICSWFPPQQVTQTGMKTSLDLIENRLREFIEGSSAVLLPGNRRDISLANRLAEAIQDAMQASEAQPEAAPNLFTLHLPPEDLPYWQERQEMLDALSGALQEAVSQTDLYFPAAPNLRLQADPQLASGDFRVEAAYPQEATGSTAVISIAPAAVEPETQDPRPANAFLIIDGTRTFPLRLPVVNIGRRLDNHLVIDDPRVSRSHAQLRAVRGHYVLFDLNSTGGTYVNSNRITQYTLKPGDVISLAGVPVIYGEDVPQHKGDTGQLPVLPRPITE